jgi:hypothetical protein
LGVEEFIAAGHRVGRGWQGDWRRVVAWWGGVGGREVEEEERRWDSTTEAGRRDRDRGGQLRKKTTGGVAHPVT